MVRLNRQIGEPTTTDRANELARMIDGTGSVEDLKLMVSDTTAIVSAFVETSAFAEIESIAAGEGFEVGCEYPVGNIGMDGASEMFVSFDYNE